jgi:hypothetical protein
MIYPYPPIPKSIFIVIIGFFLIGGGGVPIFIPGLVALKKNMEKIDPNIDDMTVNDITSAINFLTLNIGDFCGPIIGGFFSTHFGFKHSCLFVSLMILSYSLVFLLYFKNNIYSDIKKLGTIESIDDTNNNQSDEKELINHPGIYKGEKLNDNDNNRNEEYNNSNGGNEYVKFNDN